MPVDSKPTEPHKSVCFITNFHGDVLTDINKEGQLQWTNTALLEETNQNALIFRNPYQIPAQIARQLSAAHQVFRVMVPEHSDYEVGLSDILRAEYLGAYAKYSNIIPNSAIITGRNPALVRG